MSIRGSAVILVLLVGSSALFAAPALPCDSIPQYRALLQNLSEGLDDPNLDAGELATRIPEHCAFEDEGKHYSFRLQSLRDEISGIATNAEKKKETESERKEDIASAQSSIERRLAGLSSYEGGVDSTVRPKLGSILNQREFRRVSGQSVSNMMQERLLQWIAKLLMLIFKDSTVATLAAKVIVYSACAIVGLFLLWLLYRWLQQAQQSYAGREILPFAPSAKSVRRWLDEAREALAHGDLREAVHCSYWGAISHLESNGAWRPDRARTPREYVRMMAVSDSSRPVLKEITTSFEVVWYGNQVPEITQCEAFMATVEKLACR